MQRLNRLVKEQTNIHGEIYAKCPECYYKMDYDDNIEIWICPLCGLNGYTKEGPINE